MGSNRSNRGSVATLLAALLCVSAAATGGAAGAAGADARDAAPLGGSGTAEDPYRITNATDLQAMQDDLDAHYVLADDVDAGETADWNGGDGFEPIGTEDEPFTGTFDGQNHTISGLTIDRRSTHRIGLFGASAGTIRDVRLDDVEVAGRSYTGALAGSNEGEISGATVSGTVEGENSVGGLVGENDGRLARAASSADVSGDGVVAGLVGMNTGTIAHAAATGTVEGSRTVGGLAGSLNDGELHRAYSRTEVSGTDFVGGLVGHLDDGGAAESVYAAGAVSADEQMGGLVGSESGGELRDAYWDVDATGQDGAFGHNGDDSGTALSTGDLTGTAASASLADLDFGENWAATDGYPVLQSEVETVSLSLAADAVAVGNETNASVAVGLFDGRTVAATETADYATNASNAGVSAGTVATDDTGAVEITATVAGESDTATLAVLTPPDVSFVDASLPAEGVPEGSPVVAEVTLRNDGGMAGTHAVNVTVDGEHVATETVRVEGHSEQSLPVTWTPDSAGSYDLRVEGVDVGTVTTVDPDAVSVGDVQAAEHVPADEPFAVSVALENGADVPVALPAAYAVDGETVAERAVVAETGTSTVTFEHAVSGAPGDAVDHEVTVGGETLTATSEIGRPAEFTVTDVRVPDDATAGEAVTITATVENVGDLAGSDTVELRFAGEAVATETVDLAGGETAEVTAEVTPDAAGSVDVAVQTSGDERDASVTVEGADGPTATAGGADDGNAGGDGASDGGSDDGAETTAEDGPGFTAGLALLATLGAALLARNRR